MAPSTPPSTVVVTDLDGTFWGNQLVCHGHTRAAFDTLVEQGIPVLVATGRRPSSARAGLVDNGLDLPCVLLNGAVGVDYPGGGQIFHEHGFATDAAHAVLDMLDGVGLSPCVYLADGRVAVGGSVTSSLTHLGMLGPDRLDAEPRDAVELGTVLGFSMLGLDEEQLRPGADRLRDLDCGDAAFYADHLYKRWSMMIQPPGISKWEGIQAWLRHAELGTPRIIALGDGGNDLEMLEGADVGLSIEGGDPDALARADAVLPHPDQGGWAQVLDWV